jgi:hypothetical protein
MEADQRKILVVGFWGLSDPLTRSTLFPTIDLLLSAAHASRIWLVTVERGGIPSDVDRIPDGVVHVPLLAARCRPAALGRFLDLVAMPVKILKLVRRKGVGCIIARSTMAGALAYPAARWLRIPLVVESLEPHTEYMVECGEWSIRGPFAIVTRWFERQQVIHAHRLLSVTENYKRRLVAEGVDQARIHVVPCPVKTGDFAFRASSRSGVRKRLGWENDLVGVYLGKFGGLYHREWAFKVFVDSHRFFFPRFKLMILTSEDADFVKECLSQVGFPLVDVHIERIAHEVVPDYLSAADFAFSIYKGTASSAFLSPVKNGEYWCSGLPVLLTRGVSDDSALIDSNPAGGALFDPEGCDLEEALGNIARLLSDPQQRKRTADFGMKHRSSLKLRTAYAEVFSSLATKPDPKRD